MVESVRHVLHTFIYECETLPARINFKMRKMKGEKYARIHDAENAFFINYARYYFARDYKHDDNFAIIIHVNCEL